jgi:hypothetical protein
MHWTLLLALALVACGPETILAPAPPLDLAPKVLSAEGGCDGDGDGESWIFRAQVDDEDGVDDIVEVDVIVYDETTDERVDGFTLLPEEDPHWWGATVAADDTVLECAYLNYSMDFVATDAAGEAGQITAWTDPAIQ